MKLSSLLFVYLQKKELKMITHYSPIPSGSVKNCNSHYATNMILLGS